MRQSHNEEAPSHEYVRQDTSQFRPTPHASSHNNACIAEQYKTMDMWRRTGRGGTHVAVLGTAVMISFSIATLRTLAITAPTERLCDKNE